MATRMSNRLLEGHFVIFGHWIGKQLSAHLVDLYERILRRTCAQPDPDQSAHSHVIDSSKVERMQSVLHRFAFRIEQTCAWCDTHFSQVIGQGASFGFWSLGGSRRSGGGRLRSRTR